MSRWSFSEAVAVAHTDLQHRDELCECNDEKVHVEEELELVEQHHWNEGDDLHAGKRKGLMRGEDGNRARKRLIGLTLRRAVCKASSPSTSDCELHLLDTSPQDAQTPRDPHQIVCFGVPGQCGGRKSTLYSAHSRISRTAGNTCSGICIAMQGIAERRTSVGRAIRGWLPSSSERCFM